MQLSLLFYLCSVYLLKSVLPELVLKSTNLQCLPNPKRVINESCRIRALNWNKAVADLEADLLVPLRNTSVRIELFKKDYNNQYHPFLVNALVNMCDVVAKKSFAAYGVTFLKILKTYTNVNHSCPVSGHVMARGMFIDSTLIPAFPLGFYLLSVNVIENYERSPSESFGTIKYYIQVMEMVKRRGKEKLK